MKKPGFLLGEEEVLGEGEPGDEALLQPGGGHVGHALLLELVVGLAGQVGVLQVDAARRWWGPARRRRAGSTALAAAFHAGQPDGLAPADVEVDVVELDAAVLGAHAGEAEQAVAGRARHALPGRDLPLEHHGDQAVHLERGQGLADEPPLAEHGHPGAELLHLLQLVGDEEHGLALGGQTAQGGEQLLALGGADAGGGLVEDEHAGAQPQQAQDLELLALAHGEGVRRRP